jgi:capsular polysaccharide biosynthesis protein
MSGVDLTLSKQLTADFSVLAKSRPVMNKIEEKLKADYKYKDLNYSVEQLQGMITIENPSGTSLMRMTATNSDAQLAADIANAAADAVAERISEVMVIDKPSSVEEAEKPNYPVSPNVKKNMIMGGLIGAVLAVGVFTLLFLLDDTIKSEEDVRRYLQLNTLASIPKEKKRRRASSEA